MLRVTVEVVPHGDNSRSRDIATLRIGLQRVQPGNIGEYISKIQTDTGAHNDVVYLKHDRDEGALELVRKCIVAHDANTSSAATGVCAACGNAELIGVEYSFNHPGHYDGVSEWQCHCGARTGRWSGRLLGEKEWENRY
jgi:hypothetical protein